MHLRHSRTWAAIASGAVAAAAVSVAVAMPASGSNPGVRPSIATSATPDASGTSAAISSPIYQDQSFTFGERAADLVARMTLAQKASQMNSSFSPAIPSLGVPQWGWWNEALHGVAREQLLNAANATVLQNTTSYPDDQSLGSTWNPNLIYRVATQISDEAREVVTNNTENLDFYSPTMNLERDPRWGRTDEAYGEDPFLVSKEVSQFVDGLQGQTQQGRLLPQADGYTKAIATIKHFAANNSEINRLNGSSDFDQRSLEEYYTDAFRNVVEAAHPGSVMSSYNEINGVPSPVDESLNDQLLRQTFGFGGYMTSDCDAVFEVTNGHHYQPPNFTRPVNTTERSALAVAAGEDLNCQQGFHDQFSYANSLPGDATAGIPTASDTFNTNDIDTSLTRLFTARMQTGEFDPAQDVPWVTQARAELPQGTWTNSNANNAVTETPAREALARHAADESIVLLKNSTSNANGTTGQLLPLKVPSTGSYKVAVVGTLAHPDPAALYLGDYSSMQDAAGQANDVDAYTGIQKAVQAINPGATVDFVRGFTGTSSATPSCCSAIDPNAISQIQSGGYNAVIVVVGTDGSNNSPLCPGCGTENSDRTAITLPGAQSDLINQVAAANPNTVVYMQTEGPEDITSFEPNVSAIVWSSYNAQQQGSALADVLTGAYDPSGHLPATWFTTSQIPEPITDYSIRPTGGNPGRTYMYYNGSLGNVQFPFGFGMSYTRFAFSNLQINHAQLNADDSFTVTANVKNTGDVAGKQVAQLYVSQPNAPASLQRPIERLEGFQLVSLDPGQTKTVTFTIKVPQLAFFDETANKWAVDDGVYNIAVGSSSAQSDQPLNQQINVRGSLTPELNVLTAKPVMTGDPARGIQQRVMFPEGVTILPQLTASMSDDTLFGYIKAGSSRPFPNGMTFSYTSDHPDVVSVGPRGDLTTRANGAATITATAHYHGVSKSTTFVVRVLSEASGITVNGRPLLGFHPDTTDYDVILPAGSAAPSLSATTPDSSAVVAVTQPSAVPGSGTVAVTGPDGITTTYTVNFAFPAASDEFDGTDVGPQWSFVRRDSGNEQVSGGSLTINAQPGDITGTTNNAENILLQPALGDWTIETKETLSATPSVNGQQAGIIAYQDDDNFLKLDWEFSAGIPRLALTQENSLSGSPVTQSLAAVPTAGVVPGDTVWLKMVKTGPRVATFYSTDGVTWVPIYEVGVSLTDIKVGLFADEGNTTTATSLQASFDYFHVTNGISGASASAARLR